MHSWIGSSFLYIHDVLMEYRNTSVILWSHLSRRVNIGADRGGNRGKKHDRDILVTVLENVQLRNSRVNRDFPEHTYVIEAKAERTSFLISRRISHRYANNYIRVAGDVTWPCDQWLVSMVEPTNFLTLRTIFIRGTKSTYVLNTLFCNVCCF